MFSIISFVLSILGFFGLILPTIAAMSGLF